MLARIRTGDWLTAERICVYAAMVALIGAASLAFVWMTGSGLLDRFGRPIGTDFASFWTAGRMALAGEAVALYEPLAHAAFQHEAFGTSGPSYYAWHYPPFFLGLAAPLALMPYVPALLVWQGATLAAYLAAIRAILPGRREALIAAVGFPAVFVTLGHGQNAFLTAALIAFGLLMLERRPVLAGIAIGLLAYKPQYGLILPVLMVAGGHWRAIAAAGATVLAMAGAATLALGPDIWPAFLANAAAARTSLLDHSAVGYEKMQSLFAALRLWGVPVAGAYAGQGLVTAAVALTIAATVLRGADRRLTAALTIVGVVLATPFSLDYDLALLGPAVAFSVAHGLERGFAPFERSLYALAWFTPLVGRALTGATGLPLGFLVTAALFAMLAVRAVGRPQPVLPLVRA